MKIHAYLTFDGQCEAAFNHYADCLGGSLELMRMGESPEAANVPEAFHDRVMHVCLTVGDQFTSGEHAMDEAQPGRQQLCCRWCSRGRR